MLVKKQIKYFDIWLLILMIAAFVVGCIFIGSATHIKTTGNDFYVNKQIFGFVTGFILLLISAFIDYRFIGKFYIIFYLINIGLLLAVLQLGISEGGATRWLLIGGFSFQPSEFAKILCVIFMAKLLTKFQDRINEVKVLLPILIIFVLPVLLIQKQPDLSTSLIIVFVLLVMIYVANLSYKYILVGIIMGAVFLVFMIWNVHQPEPILLEKYQVTRILSLLYPEEYASTTAYQTNKSLQAIGSGQLFGKGLYEGTLSKYSYLPEPRTDFIFSVIGEDAGFVGCSTVIGIIILMLIRIIIIAKNSPDTFGKLICIGVASMLGFQSFVHMGVTTDLLPNTGIPLPFISYGLSSLWTNMIGIGLVINVGMSKKEKYTGR